jgi:hypothetical protein
MICKNCGHEISVNKICEGRLQSATDMLKHMAAHNASRDFAGAAGVMEPEPEAFIPAGELGSPVSELQQLEIASSPQSLN